MAAKTDLNSRFAGIDLAHFSGGDALIEQAIAALQQMASVDLSHSHQITGSGDPLISPAQLRYRALVEQIPAVTFMAALDESVHELYISPQIEVLLGYSQEEWLQDPFLWYRQLHPADSAQWGIDFARTCATGVNFRSEYRLIARDGHVVWVHGECQLITNEDGRPLFLMGIAFDITDRKRSEQELQESNDELESARTALTEMNQTLEQRVEARTSELEMAHTKMVQIARQAGMAEVASEVLHNVGNLFNSVNIRASMVRDQLKKSRVDQFEQVNKLLDAHAGDLAEFITKDPGGKLLPDYIKKLSTHLIEERKKLVDELDVLHDHLQHIKRLVSSQQSYAKGAVLYEQTDIANLVTDALNVTFAVVARHNVTVERNIPDLPRLTLDRHRILQILVNLISNAAQACAAIEHGDRRVTVTVHQPDFDRIHFEVTDNGIGVMPENLTRIFSHGFTTKAEGHGFGLHSSANAAREMGGSLNVVSKGIGHGATFILALPVQEKKTLG
ncbi:hypothetical protein BH10PLA1_BH10PLA1_13890 [soil metagenome]